MKLISLEDLPDNFKVQLVKSLRENLFKKAVEKVGSVKELITKLKISDSVFYDLKHGYQKRGDRITKIYIKMPLLKELSRISEITLKEIQKHTVRITTAHVLINVNFPLSTTPELASLVGHVFGDGHINNNHFHYCNKNIELIEEVKNNVKKIFGVEYNEIKRHDKEFYDLNFPSTIGRILVLVGAPNGRKVPQELCIPSWIKGSMKEVKIAFIKALFDDEGWVGITKGNFCIGFGQNKKMELLENHRIFLNEIKSLLSEFNVNSSKIYKRSQKNDSVQLGFKIICHKNLLNYCKNIGFNHSIKQNKLKKILKNYKQIQYGKKEAKLKVITELINGPKSSKEIAKTLDRDQKTIWKHLHQLHKKDKVIKIGSKKKVFWRLNNLKSLN